MADSVSRHDTTYTCAAFPDRLHVNESSEHARTIPHDLESHAFRGPAQINSITGRSR